MEDMLAKFMAKLSCLYILHSADIINYMQITYKKKKHRSQPERICNGKIYNNMRKKIHNNIEF